MSNIISNPSADRNDKIANAVAVLGKSKDRIAVFSAIYLGKTKVKTVNDIEKITRLRRIRILQEGRKLASEDIVNQIKMDGTAYEKKDFYTQNKHRILSLAKNKKKLANFPTKINPRINLRNITLSIPKNKVDTEQITIDDIDSFSAVKKTKSFSINAKRLYESKFKDGIKKIIGERGTFTDWGGETNDLFSTRLKINGKRFSAAIALKGRGTTGILTPKKMGKNGDQIQRLFTSPANVFIIQYGGQIHDSVLTQMKTFAISKSLLEKQCIYFGIIDGNDTSRLIKAYPNVFR